MSAASGQVYILSTAMLDRDKMQNFPRHDYNRYRRHSSLGYLPPARYAATPTHR
jgi:transposase InsO family protein